MRHIAFGFALLLVAVIHHEFQFAPGVTTLQGVVPAEVIGLRGHAGVVGSSEVGGLQRLGGGPFQVADAGEEPARDPGTGPASGPDA